MDKQRLFDLYEKLYFHEMEVREKITSRVQITFALIATGYTILSYMLRMLDLTGNYIAIGVFGICTLVSFIISFGCLYYLVRAFWGNTYNGMPSPKDTDKYREDLIRHKYQISQYNLDYPDHKQPEVNIDDRVSEHLYTNFRDCSAHNTMVNDRRSRQIHKAFKWLLFASIPMFIASITFISFDLDISSPRKETSIIDQSVATALNEIKQELTIFTEIYKGKDKVPEVKDNYVPPPPQAPQEPDARPLVENGPLPNAGE
ncbi:hypothetical protein C9J41_05815 [Photobacterium sp. GB-50]|uniref:hypothetical protein n=1 Tax=Photobacterium sp. GB-50 TaxID=2022107 RepID=UPI000D1562E0|nr:hypothetical protein [Photobacterium sp. GB-50]PSW74389.1 hypothetical protein C9J41_05815 [Photobacterium sp. GB-50]